MPIIKICNNTKLGKLLHVLWPRTRMANFNEPHNSLRIRLRAAHTYTHIGRRRGGGNWIRQRPLFTSNTLRSKYG